MPSLFFISRSSYSATILFKWFQLFILLFKRLRELTIAFYVLKEEEEEEEYDMDSINTQ